MQKLKPSLTTSRPHGSERRTVRSDDGSLAFTLSRTPFGLYVERVRLLSGGKRVVQSVVFPDASSFEQWCDGDMQRFEFPLLFALLKRDGNALLIQ